MLRNISRGQCIGAWLALVLVIGACSIVAGVDITIGNGELLLVAGLVPPAIMLLVWRGPPPLTVAELLHSVDDRSAEVRP